LEPSSNSDDGEESEEAESDDSVFMMEPRGTTVLEIVEGSRMSTGAPEVRKHAMEDDVA
jgi:hypothetical protein